MNVIVWLFVYTPLPWLVAMYVAAYRHDLARIARPLRDSATKADWWDVCRHLGLIDGTVARPSESLGRRNWLALAVAVVVGSLWVLIPVSLAWYELCALQAAAAFPLFLALVRAVGPLPYRPYQDFLPYPRLGARVRHLSGATKPDSAASTTKVGGSTR